jgi:hypothetical protein
MIPFSSITACVGKFLRGLKLKDMLWIVGVILAIILFKQCSTINELRQREKIIEQNAIALTDTVKIERTNRERTLNAYKAVMVADQEELKKLNSDLYWKIDSLKRVKGIRGNVLTFQEAGVNIKGDTGMVEATVVYVSPSGDVRLRFERDTAFDAYNSRGLAGHLDFHIDSMDISNASMTIDRDDISMSLATGITEEDGTYKIFVSSDFPGFTVTKLDGAVLDPKMLRKIASDESSFIFGPQLGFGYSFGSSTPAPIIGIGISYNVNKPFKSLLR